MNQEESHKADLIEPRPGERPKLKTPRTLPEQTAQAGFDSDHFFSQSIDLLCIAGFDGYFQRLNPAWKSVLGWTLEELEAAPFFDFVHPEDMEATRAELAKLVGGADAIYFENRYRHQDGSYRWLQWYAHPVPCHRQIYAAARDVTGHKRLEASLEIIDQGYQRLRRDLHDGLCQTLAGIAALSATLSRRLTAAADANGSAIAAEISGLLNEAIGEVHDLAHGLGPFGLKQAGLAKALGDLSVTVQYLHRVACTLECDGPFPRLDEELEENLFRIVQEAISNALAHGRADQIEIGLSCRHGEGVLSVRDNGVGLPDEAKRRAGTGLQTMAYRAHTVGAAFELRQSSPRGTAVICTFALPEPSGKREDRGHARR
jgi:PAS domain S-box-containing protein